MDLMSYVPNFSSAPSLKQEPIIIHNCETPKIKDEIKSLVRGKTFTAKLRRWYLRQCILSRTHPLTRWCLKSTVAVHFEITRHLRTYPYMIHPFSSFRIIWESVMTIFTFIALLITPVLIAFNFKHYDNWHVLNNIIDFVFISDIVIWFFTGYYDYRTKVIVLDPRIVATKYLKGFFILDIIPVLPLELIEDALSRPIWYCAALNLFKIFRMRTIIIYSRRLHEVYRINFQVHKMLEMTMIVIMCIHWCACLEYYVPLATAEFAGINKESWIESEYLKSKKSKLNKYLICVNRATTALVFSRHFLDMKTPEDIILNLILTVIGVFGFIYLLAQFSQLMTTSHSTSKRHLKLMQQLKEYIWHKELPQSLQRRLLIFYNYRNKKGFERDKQIINQVSPYLREELILHNYLNLMKRVELFQHLPEGVVTKLTTSVRSEIFMKNDVLIKAGTQGNALYFIASGTMAVYNSSGKEVCHLEDGAYFGEVALVMESEQRIATVIAIETCEVNIIYRHDFQQAIAPYPDLLNRLQNVILDNLGRTLLLDEISKLKVLISPSHINVSSIKGKKRE